eukprot:318912-Prymnesium_polylepis.1
MVKRGARPFVPCGQVGWLKLLLEVATTLPNGGLPPRRVKVACCGVPYDAHKPHLVCLLPRGYLRDTP